MADHLIDIVNEEDEVIGQELKSRKSELGFISRVVAVVVRDLEGRIVICKRSPNKSFDANKYDFAAVGHVDAGETYEHAAQRELMEEAQIKSSVQMLDKLYEVNEDNGKIHKSFCVTFLVDTDETPHFNDETVSFRKMSVQEIEKEMQETPEKFCQGFIKDFNRVKNKL